MNILSNYKKIILQLLSSDELVFNYLKFEMFNENVKINSNIKNSFINEAPLNCNNDI